MVRSGCKAVLSNGSFGFWKLPKVRSMWDHRYWTINTVWGFKKNLTEEVRIQRDEGDFLDTPICLI